VEVRQIGREGFQKTGEKGEFAFYKHESLLYDDWKPRSKHLNVLASNSNCEKVSLTMMPIVSISFYSITDATQ